MKVIIAGSRSIKDINRIYLAVKKAKYDITEVVCGMAQGVDLLGRKWAIENNVPVKEYHANWNEFGKMAGFIRNNEMAEYADAAIVVWDGVSSGSKHMIDAMTRRKKRCYIYEIPE